MTLKDIGIDFITMCARGDSREAFSKYVHPEFKHHNAYFKGDADTLMVAMEQAHKEDPNKVFQVQRALWDGDLVALHSYLKKDMNDVGYVVMHIMRFKDARIIEMWDFGQAIPQEMANEYGML